jgi:hypothetical protein
MNTLRNRRYHLDALFLFQVYPGSKFRHLKIISREWLIGISDTLFCSMSAPQAKIAPLLCALLLLMLLIGTLTYFGSKTIVLRHIL